MAVEKDILAGLDLSSITSPTKAQVIQAINQLAPLANKGFLIVSDTEPDVASNSRYTRYLWIDITDPTLPNVKAYSTSGGGTWISTGLAADAVIQAYIGQYEVSIYDTDGSTKKISLKGHTGGVATVDGTKVGYILRIDSAGSAVEIAPLSTILTSGVVPITAIAAGTNNQFLRMDGTTVTWETVSPVDEISDETIALAKLDGDGNANYLIVQNSTGAGITAKSVDTMISSYLSAGGLALSKIAQSSATTGQVIQWSGSAWAPASLANGTTEFFSAESSTGTLNTAGAHTFGAHGLSGIPRNLRLVMVCKVTNLGYSVNDEVEAEAFFADASSNEDGRPIMHVYADATNIYGLVDIAVGAAEIALMRVSGGGGAGEYTAITRTSWTPKVYAWY